jgi:hypothetical protein
MGREIWGWLSFTGLFLSKFIEKNINFTQGYPLGVLKEKKVSQKISKILTTISTIPFFYNYGIFL